MKSILLLAALFLVSTLAGAAEESNKPKAKVEVKKVEEQSSFKSLLDQTWAKLRRYGPPSARDDASRQVTLVAGVRGAESTTSTLKPYWKGDKTNDPAYLNEVNAFNKAQAFANSGDFKQAATAFDGFLTGYPDSSLKPNAQFALGLAYAGVADKARGVSALQTFVQGHPKHPLASDANRVIAELQKL